MQLRNIFQKYGLDPEALEQVTGAFKLRKYRPHGVIFREGDPSEKFYFVKSGKALATRKMTGGHEEPINVLKEGQFFGVIGLMENINRIVTVKAISPLALFELSRDEFNELLKSSPPFAKMIKDMSVRRLLKQVSIFKELDEEHLKHIQEILLEKTYPADEVIFRENDPPDAVYAILKGTVRVYRRTEYGKDITLAYLSHGDFFGELGLIESVPRSATVVTSDECKLLVIRKDDFQELLKENAAISFNMLKVLSHRMRETSKEMSSAKSISFFKGMTIISRPDRCMSCRTCEIACAVAKSRTHRLYDSINEKPLPVKRIHVRKVQHGTAGPVIRPEHCLHCKDAPCLTSCKFEAIKKDVVSGTIAIVEEKCVGCGLCARACPFDVISLIRAEGKRRVALKCTYCREHQAGPACVRSCPTNALVVALAPTVGFDDEIL
jgi:carbon-monoxide dehydrogenase iron sulfur subunit